ncbi:MAG TPA: YbdK family carboxylate-amine ligase [Gaiellaceae bacterium]|nr:YbdK family carboxylate-amine ligase [Gaiellaceae bacterium]
MIENSLTERTVSDPYALAAPVWHEAPLATANEWRARFDTASDFTIGVEDELMLVDPATLKLAPQVDRVLALVSDDARFTRELRSAQIEIVTPVCENAAEACAELSDARRKIVGLLDGSIGIAAAGTHPFSTDWGTIADGDRYRAIADEFTWAARRSLACGLHVHVAVPGAERALAVYNALRSYLPLIAALGTNSPFIEGFDSGLCSIRPKLNEAFPRAGVPPRFDSWEALVEFIDWGRSGGLFPDHTHFWWDLRPHLDHGTLELRAADAQTRVEDAAAIAALFQALVLTLAERHDEGDVLPVHDTHRITENAWRAYRYGVRGWLVDLDTGEPQPTRELLASLIDDVAAAGRRLACVAQLEHARTLLAGNGADRQRYVEAREGMLGLASWLMRETQAA